MSRCVSFECCERWVEIRRAYRAGLQLEAAMAAAREITRDKTGGCRWAPRTIKLMQEEGWLDAEKRLLP